MVIYIEIDYYSAWVMEVAGRATKNDLLYKIPANCIVLNSLHGQFSNLRDNYNTFLILLSLH